MRATRSSRALRRLAWALLRLHRAALRHPRRTVLAAAALALAAALGLPRATLRLSIRELEDPRLPSARWTREAEAAFGAEHPLLLLFAPRQPGGRLGEPALRAIAAFVERERARNPELVRAASPFDVLAARRVDGRLRLVPAMEAPTPAALQALAAGPFGGLLTDAGGRDVAVSLAFRDTPGGGRTGRFDPAVVAAVEARCRAEVLAPNPDVRLLLGGAAAFDHYAREGVRRFRWLNVAVVLVLLGGLRLLLGAWRGGLLLVGVVVFAGLVVHGAMAWSGVPVDLLSTGLFLMLAVAAVEDFVYLAHERLAHGTAWRAAFRRLLLPGFLTSLTTVVGFASLGTSDLVMVRRFGLWGGAGAALEWAATFLVLPALLALVPALRAWTAPRRALALPGARWLARLRLPRPLALLLLAAHAAALFAALHLEYRDAPGGMFPPGHPFREGLEYARATRGWSGQLDVVLPEGAAMSDVDREAAALRADPAVARVLDPASLLRAYTGGDQLALFELAGDRAALAAAEGALSGKEGRLRLSAFLAESDLVTLQGLRDRIAARHPDGEGFPAGDLAVYADVGGAVPQTLVRSLATCLALVGLLIAWLFHALGRPGGLRAVAASSWGPALALVAMWALRVPVNFVSASFASVLVGLTGDNAVQFACAARRGGALGPGIARRSGAAAMVALVMGASALVFLGSAFLPTRRLGLLLAFGLGASLAGDVWILGALTRPRGAAPAPADEGSPA